MDTSTCLLYRGWFATLFFTPYLSSRVRNNLFQKWEPLSLIMTWAYKAVILILFSKNVLTLFPSILESTTTSSLLETKSIVKGIRVIPLELTIRTMKSIPKTWKISYENIWIRKCSCFLDMPPCLWHLSQAFS